MESDSSQFVKEICFLSVSLPHLYGAYSILLHHGSISLEYNEFWGSSSLVHGLYVFGLQCAAQVGGPRLSFFFLKIAETRVPDGLTESVRNPSCQEIQQMAPCDRLPGKLFGTTHKHSMLNTLARLTKKKKTQKRGVRPWVPTP